MTKRTNSSRLSTSKGPTPSPNTRDKKHTKTDPSDATVDPNGEEIVENHMSGLNLLDQLNASTAPSAVVKPGDVKEQRPPLHHA